MPRLLPHPLLTPVLALIWMLLNNSFTLGQLTLGLLFGWLIPLFTLRFWPERTVVRSPIKLMRFFAVLLYDILIANINVARLILGPKDRLKPAFVEVPLDIHSELGISLLANAISLTPGTVSALLSPDQKTLTVHVLDLDDTQSLIETIKQRYEKPLMEAFDYA